MGVLTDVFAPGAGLLRKKGDSKKRDSDDVSPKTSDNGGGDSGHGVVANVDRILKRRASSKRS